jgi:hypothetical protein
MFSFKPTILCESETKFGIFLYHSGTSSEAGDNGLENSIDE